MATSRVWGILVAGGTGSRFHADQNKLLAEIQGKSVFRHSLEKLVAVFDIAGIVVVVHPQWREVYETHARAINTSKPILWAAGGATRRDSVYRGLQALPDMAEIVLIHDAARPLVSPGRIRAALLPVIQGQARGTSLGYPVRDTIKTVHSPELLWVKETPSRNTLWATHTPQVFLKSVILQAHQALPQAVPVTDDAELVERLLPGEQAVLMVEDTPDNLKITTPTDLYWAEAVLAAANR